MLKSITDALEKAGYSFICENESIITTHNFQNVVFNIEGKISEPFPFKLPRLYLLERNRFGHLAHVGWDLEKNKGIICEGVSINRHTNFSMPDLVYIDALKNAEKTIVSALSDKDRNESEIVDEFTAHWRVFTQKNSSTVLSFIEPQDEITQIQILSKKKSPWETVLYQTNNDNINEKYLFKKTIKNKSQTIGQAYYLPIKKRILPPIPGTPVFEWWQSLLENLTNEQKDKLKTFSRKNHSNTVWILGSVNINDEKTGWFCIKFTNTKKSIPPFYFPCESENWKADANGVDIHNKSYLKPRGGAAIDSGKTKIAIVGCGSVGAEIARQLICSGIENIELVDYDIMSIENIYRHCLASEYIGYSKTNALANDLSCKYPYVNIEESKLRCLKDCLNTDFLDNISGIIVATGSQTDERFFNEELIKYQKRPWVIYAWVEGHGFGGHSIYVHSSGKGCLNCLYRDQFGNKSLESIQNFLKAEQEVTIDLAGCGSHFLPFSYADATQTALLAVRLASLANNGKLQESCRMSWKSSHIENTVLETSYRFKNFNRSLVIEKLYWEQCDVCNKQS